MRDKLNRPVLGIVMLVFLGMFTLGQVPGGTVPTERGHTIPPDASPGSQPPTRAGSADAAVQIEVFVDFSCPQCAVKNPVYNEIRAIYGDRISFVFRQFPLDLPSHDKSYEAAIAAEAAGFQGKYLEMQDLLLVNQKIWTASPNYKEIWKGYARRLRLDVKKWEDDRAGIPARSRVDADMKRARSIGVRAVPTLFLNNVEIPFAELTVDDLRTAIDAELAKSKEPAKNH